MGASRNTSYCAPPDAAVDAEAARSLRGSSKCGADRMVKIELEAAEALAGLARSVVREAEREISGGEFGVEPGSQERVGDESPAVDSAPMHPNLAQVLKRTFDWEVHIADYGIASDNDLVLNLRLSGFSRLRAWFLFSVLEGQDQVAESQQYSEEISSLKGEDDTELELNAICTTSYASCAGIKSKQNMTEAEKESRKLRRVLANRESARQTIRRRQALYAELTRKAADLALENENLKKEKDVAMDEYDSLKITNECLKAQMTEMVKAEPEEIEVEAKSTHVDIPTSPSTNCPVFIVNRPPFLPCLWHSIIQPPNSVQLECGPHSGIAIPLQFPMQASGRPDFFHQQETSTRTNGSGTPLYVLPGPWIFPLHHHSNGLYPQSFNLNGKHDSTSLDNQCSTSSSSKTEYVDTQHPVLPIKFKANASTVSLAIPTNNLQEKSFGFLPDGGGPHIGSDPQGMVLLPAPVNCVGTAAALEHENSFKLECRLDAEVILPAHGNFLNGRPSKEQIISQSKKPVDVVAAAEARKRRKEVTRLKNIHCRQARMQY
ncbi:hypothetical protein RJ639_002125 [Escallonia herrerae]|uniref:BZIP domain-containing protein n=1 Tax=Escallonia herrerae TaxID=1293975 RepID=A0AA89BTS1_9ASTE|nr:hypothetical protein RJ639_002125 [Escallonia herrerae]